ncbi:MAG: TIGR04211 family SH3 domain-containing protein [Pseudomonadota bacterium]
MKKIWPFIKVLVCLAGVILSAGLPAETRYITDQVKIMVRSGEGNTYKIVRMLTSGTPVEILGTNPGSGYSRIRTAEGDGFVLSHEIMKEPSARQRLTETQNRLDEILKSPDQLSAQLAKLQDEHQQVQKAYQEIREAKRKGDEELASIRRTYADAVRIANERNELRKTVAELTREVEVVRQENRELGNREYQNWFLIGAGVLVLGVLIGLILPRLHFQRRRSSWQSL